MSKPNVVPLTPRAPIFIGGLYKSGTTLLRAMLGQHSAIASGLETYWFDIDWNGDRGTDFLQRIELLEQFYGIDADTMKQIVRSSASTVDFLNQVLGRYTAAQNKRRWAEKTPGNIIHVERILEGWPDAKIIHIKRDPRDVYASLKQARKWGTVPEFVGHWCRMLGGAEAAKRKLRLDSDTYLEVQYEALVLNPHAKMRTVINFVGEEWEQAVADFQGKEEDFYMLRRSTGKSSTTLERLQQPLSNQRVGIWPQIVEDEELEQIRQAVDGKGLLGVFDRMIAEAGVR